MGEHKKGAVERNSRSEQLGLIEDQMTCKLQKCQEKKKSRKRKGMKEFMGFLGTASQAKPLHSLRRAGTLFVSLRVASSPCSDQ